MEEIIKNLVRTAVDPTFGRIQKTSYDGDKV